MLIRKKPIRALGTVVEGYEEHALRIKKVKGVGFHGDAKRHHVLIKTITIYVPSKTGTNAFWHDNENEAVSQVYSSIMTLCNRDNTFKRALMAKLTNIS